MQRIAFTLTALACLALLAGGCGEPEPPPEPEQVRAPHASPAGEDYRAELAGLFPDSVGEWSLDYEPYVFVGPDELYQFINGAGEVFLTYDFRAAANAIYIDPDGLTLSVELFRMGDPDSAYGVFSLHQPAGAEPDPDEPMVLYAAPYSMYFQAGTDYGRIIAFSDDPESEAGMAALRRAIAPRTSGPEQMPPIARALPGADRPIPGLTPAPGRPVYFRAKMALDYELFIDENIFGLGEDTAGALQYYATDRGPLRLMLIRYPDIAAAAAGPEFVELNSGETIRTGVVDPDPADAAGCVFAVVLAPGAEALDEGVFEEWKTAVGAGAGKGCGADG